jgi:glycosyltransferase involved in cell wall biosynthesis
MKSGSNRPRVIFVSTLCSSPWGGSEFLWRDAALRLVAAGCPVVASVQKWNPRSHHLAALAQNGVVFHERVLTGPLPQPFWFWRFLKPFRPVLSRVAFRFWLARQAPGLVCFTNGDISDGFGFLKICMEAGRPYTIVVQANSEQWWPSDVTAQALAQIYQQARRVFFVSQRNRELLETQLAVELVNAEVVRNPYNVTNGAPPPWPASSDLVKFACVGRLEPVAKGQDLLLRVLASEPWRSRKFSVSFFGRGDCEAGVRRLAARLGITDKLHFAGHVDDINSLWAGHHALVLPSRFEGLPLVLVEAMLCGRPAIVTDVAGNAELLTDGRTGFIAEAATEKHLNAALERAWEQRHRWEAIGQAAAVAIRQLLPADPAADFAKRLVELCDGPGTTVASQVGA